MKMKIKIIFENENFMCVDKPAGLVVHSDGRTEEDTLTDFLKQNPPNPPLINGGATSAKVLQKDIGNPHTLDSGRYTERWGIVNRLDRDTSGLILIAKNQNAFLELQKLFQENKIQKIYQALVWGQVNFHEKIINQKITRHKTDPRIWTCGFTAQEGGRESGREAETFITPPRTGSASVDPLQKGATSANSALVQTKVFLYPKTGRTHQLRLHCRFIGHPIVGDDKYGLNGKINEYSTRQIENYLTQPLLTKERSSATVQEIDKKYKLQLIAKSLEFELLGEKYFLESEFELN